VGRALDYVSATGEARKIVNWLLSDCVIVNDLSAAIAAANEFPDLSFVTLDGDLLERDGTLWAGLFPDEQRKKLTELRAIRDELKKNLSLREAALKSVTEERSAHGVRKAQLVSERDRIALQMKSLDQRSSSVSAELAREKNEMLSQQKELKTRKPPVSGDR
jgi:chromosome segregation protein